jgi:dienelactone hydrolase
MNRSTPADTSHSGTDLIVRELATGVTRNIGNVNLYDFDDAGRLLAYSVDAGEKLGNGIYVLDLSSGETRTLNGGAADFDQLGWSDEGANLVVLRGEKQRANRQKENTLLAWTDVGTPQVRASEYDPTKDPSFTRGMVISEFTAPRWSKDGARIFFGVKEQEPEPPRNDSGEPQANVDVWHYKDVEAQSVQMIRLQQERRATYPAVLTVASRRFLQLGDSAMRTVTATPNAKWGIGRNDVAYRGEVEWGASRADYYRVNLETGEKTLIAQKLSRTMGTSPDSKWFLYLKDKHVMAYNLESGKAVAVDATVGKSFVDADDDHPYEKPTYGLAGWSSDGKSVLLNHKYDVYALPLDGGKAVNLTAGAGDAREIEFRLVNLAAGGRGGGRGGGGGFGAGGGGEENGIDLSKPQLARAYGQWTKKTGYFRVTPGKEPEPLIWADKSIGNPTKATDADRIIFTEQTFTEFPDYWVSNASFETPRKLTDANPQLAEYAWGSKVLIDYKNSKGQRLQGTLTLPAGYEKGKKYPMLVYFYEIMSNTHHTFSMPVYDDRPHMSTYASDGYLVFQPDVVYEIGKPGSSAVDCVTSAVKKVIELGYADPKHIGLQGHSWGGYQSSYIVTQTDMFAAVVTGAPPTNLISFYDELYKSTGTVQQGIMELGQVRMGDNVTPWTAHDLYEQQSPVYNVRNIKTPFLILQGTADGAVDWVEGLQFFNAARRNGKQVIFLSYPDEPHHLAKKENQKDFQVRMKQFFDHYLKGTPAPKWMTDGVPQVRKGGAIQ